MRYRFELNGVTPLLMHNDNVEASDELEQWRKNPRNKGISKAGDDRSPAWTWQTYLYHDGEQLALPSSSVMVALRQAGSQVVMRKQKTFKEASQSGMFITDEYLDFLFGDPLRRLPVGDLPDRDESFSGQADAVRKLGFRLFAKRARVGSSKHVRVRARFDRWQVVGEVLVNAPELTSSVLLQLFEIAGRGGLCDWRPACKTPGPFGMFSAKVVQV